MKIFLVFARREGYWSGETWHADEPDAATFRAFEDSLDAKIYAGELRPITRYESVETMEIELKRAGPLGG